jgi:hypothetical protein
MGTDRQPNVRPTQLCDELYKGSVSELDRHVFVRMAAADPFKCE